MCAGKFMNIVNGNKYQENIDYTSGGLSFSRAYNSLDGIWRHGFSSNLRLSNPGYISVVRSDGREIYYSLTNGVATALRPIGESLTNVNDQWVYNSSDGDIYTYNAKGVLVEWLKADGVKYTLTRSGTGNDVTVTNNRNESLSFTEDYQRQPLTLTAPGVSITYEYTNTRLTAVVTNRQGTSTRQTFSYEDTRNPALLTGITDANGVRFATWGYDDQGRAIFSEHANGAERVNLAYNTDGSTSVANEYGKKATYRFQTFQGLRRVTSIEGEPTPNCPYSNSTFTYDDRGLLKTRTDNKGNLTTYDYDARALEISRTEASGTPEARTIITEWHPTLFLKTKVTEPSRITTYQYDAQGRPLGQTVTPR